MKNLLLAFILFSSFGSVELNANPVLGLSLERGCAFQAWVSGMQSGFAPGSPEFQLLVEVYYEGCMEYNQQ